MNHSGSAYRELCDHVRDGLSIHFAGVVRSLGPFRTSVSNGNSALADVADIVGHRVMAATAFPAGATEAIRNVLGAR
jgi:hypothetical protein